MRSFTLIEFVVVVSIIAILAAGVIFSFPSGQAAYRLLNATEEIEAGLRKAQGLAIAAAEFEKISATPPGGWGVHFFTSENCYLIFADHRSGGNQQYTPSGQENTKPCDTSVEGANTERLEHVFLPRGVSVTNLFVEGRSESDGELSILFQAPLARVFYDGIAADTLLGTKEARIELTFTTLGATKTIIVNAVGNVMVP